MSNHKSKVYGLKRLLNGPGFHSTACVSSNITLETYKHSGHVSCWGDMSISDCNRVVTLDLGFSTKKEFENSLYKLDTLISACKEAKDNLEKAHQKKLKVERKKKKKVKNDKK